MTWLWVAFWRRLNGWRSARFSLLIASSHPASFFHLEVRVSWKFENRVDFESNSFRIIREAVRQKSEDMLGAASVLMCEPIVETLSEDLSHFICCGLNGAPLQVRASVKVEIDSASRAAALDFCHRSGERAAGRAAELERVKFLQSEILADPALGRIWWMLQRPELIREVGNELFMEVLAYSRSERAGGAQADGMELLPVLIEFVRWLNGQDHRADVALRLFDALLETLDERVIQSELRKIRPDLRSAPD